MSKLLTPQEALQAIANNEKLEHRWHYHEEWAVYRPLDYEVSIKDILSTAYLFRLAQEMITIGDVSFPKPELKPLKDGDEYWMADPTHKRYALLFEWSGDEFHKQALSRAIVHKSKENAIAHAHAIIKLSGGKVDD